MWKYYKDSENQVYAYAFDGSEDSFIKPGLTPITEAEADELRNPAPSLPSAEQQIARRSAMLKTTDWYAIRASEPGGTPIPDDVLAYRQALREIDKQPGWPENVNWPVLSESE